MAGGRDDAVVDLKERLLDERGKFCSLRKRALQGYLWVTGTPFSLEYPSLRGGFGWHDISWKHHFQV